MTFLQVLGLVVAVVVGAVLGYKARVASVAEERAKAMHEVDAHAGRVERELAAKHLALVGREAAVAGRETAFQKGFVEGRRWLAGMIADAELSVDRCRQRELVVKKRPALAAAVTVKEIAEEKRDLMARLKFLEYQLKSYEEWFPTLADYREALLEELIPVGGDRDGLAEIENADPALPFLSREEYEGLSPTKRNQLALDRYRARDKSDWEIGRHYERILGYLYERDGWIVTYHGAVKGFEDFGRDLICERAGEIEVVQAKCWSKSKVLHEKHVFQLFGSTMHFRKERSEMFVTPVLISTTELSEFAKEAAQILGVRVETRPLEDFPLVKCNVNPSTGERIYHLPFDQQFDRVQIKAQGESFEWTIEAAEAKGFRRAYRHRFT